MHLTTGYIIPALCLLDICHAFGTTDCPKDGNPCAQAVTDTYRGPTFTAQAKADCSSFQEDTLYGHTLTVTGYPPPTPTAGTKTRPIYVSEQCTLDADYASACSCYGFPRQTVHLSNATTTITIPPTTATTTTTTTTTTSESYGPEYTPDLPFSYSTCDFDPLNGGRFDLLGPNAQFIVNRNGKAVEFKAPEGDVVPVPGYRFYSPPNSTENTFDVIIPGERPVYLAVFSSGGVGFVKRSSNGQTYVPSPSSSDGSDDEGQYVTTIWSVQCNGLATAGILGGIRFDFTIKDNGDLAVGSYRAGRRSHLKDRRQSQTSVPVPGDFYIMPKAVIVPPVGNIPSGDACLSSQQHVKAEAEITDSPSSQCGSEDWREYFVPKFDFEDGCRFLHKCWATCTQTMTSCNEAFLSLLLGTCDSSVSSSSGTLPSNSTPPSSSPSPSSPSPSHGLTTNLTACHNLAHFTHYHLSSTPHAFAVYASVYSQACDSSSSSSSSTSASTSTSSCDQSSSESGGSSYSNSTTTTPYCSGTVAHPYMTTCPINTSTKKETKCVDLSTDPSHCGHCSFSCPSGSKCINGACSSPTCKGRAANTCGDWNTGIGSSCGSGGSTNCMCVKALSVRASMGGSDDDGEEEEEEEEEEGFCVDGAMPCKLLKECEGSEQCFLGSVCVKGCCGKGVCVETDWCVAGDGGRRLFETGGDTLGRKFDGR